MEEGTHQILPLSALCTKRNILLPIFRLPPEILAIIFIHGAIDYYHESDDSGRLTHCVPTWVNISYVCSYWRNIALGYPALWTYHFNVSLRWTEELLLRSKEAPLKISYIYTFDHHKEDYRWPNLLENLLVHAERMQELRLDVPASFLPGQLSLYTPRLEKLEIRIQTAISMFITIADGGKPLLRTLRLINCLLPWYSLNLSGLKTLFLSYTHSSSPSMVEFLSILGNMQGLTILHLENALPDARDFLSSGLGTALKVNLPRLSLFAVVAPLSTVVALLSCVKIPSKARLSIEPLFEPGATVDDYAPISSFLSQQFGPQSSDPTFRSLVFEASRHASLTFGFDRDVSLLEEVDNAPLKFNLGDNVTLGGIDDEDTLLTKSDTLRIISAICRSLPLQNVQYLHVLFPHFASSILNEILGCVDGLQHLKLSGGTMPDLSVLSLAVRDPTENLDGQPIDDQNPTLNHGLVPALEALELHRIVFSEHTSPEEGMSQASLFDTVSTRKGLQDRVTMTECRTARDG